MTVVDEYLWRIPLAVACVLAIITLIICITDPTMINKAVEHFIQCFSDPTRQAVIIVSFCMLLYMLLGGYREEVSV